jgi:prepilin-type N-terminal cleavage/methylation domain-containing protein
MNPQAQTRQRPDEGFTLVEVLMALLILAIVSLGIAGMFSHAMVVNASGYDYARLASQTRFVLEELRARPYDDATLNPTGGTPRTWIAVGGAGYSNRGFTATYTVDEFLIQGWGDLAGGAWPAPAGGAQGNTKRITVTVTSTAQTLQGNRVLTASAVKMRG